MRDNQKAKALKTIKHYVNKRGGKLHEKKYLGHKELHRLSCEKGHEWQSRPATFITNKTWCPVCAGIAKKTIADARALAKQYSGRCLSDTYRNTRMPLLWECSEGHTWEKSYSDVKAGRWCPQCTDRPGESLCRAYFERCFLREFPRTNPPWLTAPSGRSLQLDGYCAEMKLAFEYQGIQHYERIPFFERSRSQKAQRGADLLKRKLCKNHGVKLVEVRFFPRKLSESVLQDIFTKLFRRHKLRPKVAPADSGIKISQILAKSKKGKLQENLKNDSLVLHSEAYLGTQYYHEWRCRKCDHVWTALTSNILNGKRCPSCAGNRKLNIEVFQDIARKRGGKCLSKRYRNAFMRLRFSCKKGHEWESLAMNIRKGSWCPSCSGHTSRSLKDLRSLAAERGGKYCERRPKKTAEKATWRCAKGHRWQATIKAIVKGRWCPTCANNVPSWPEIHELSSEQGFQCLSESGALSNNKVKILLLCRNGHKWESTVAKLKQRNGCRKCSYQKMWETRRKNSA